MFCYHGSVVYSKLYIVILAELLFLLRISLGCFVVIKDLDYVVFQEESNGVLHHLRIILA
jgi:hypothetical protein